MLEPKDDGYRVRLLNSPAGQADARFSLRWPQPVVPDTPKDSVNLRAVGIRLFDALFADGVGECLRSSLGILAADEGLRINLRLNDAPELAALPWELLYDPHQERFLALSERTPVVRYLALPLAEPSLSVDLPLRVLVVLSDPQGSGPALNVEAEWQALQQALADLVERKKIVLERLPRPTLAHLQQRLLGADVHVLHFVGHGFFDPDEEVGALIFEDGQGAPIPVSARRLAPLLHNHRALRLVYLNACEGAATAQDNLFAGVAQTLVQQTIPAALAMQWEIGDRAAVTLAHTFYKAVAAGYPVDAALTQARVALSAADSAEWSTPVLFSRSQDNRLFDILDVLETPTCPYPGMEPFSEAESAFFFGRETMIAEIVDRIQLHPFLAIIGLSGSGKSSLARAGVVPALRTQTSIRKGWRCQVITPRARPLQALAAALDLPADLLADDAVDLAEHLPPRPEPTLVVVDQFEEVYTQNAVEEATRFQTLLDQLAALPGYAVIITVRADFYPDLMQSPLWTRIEANHLNLKPLSRRELREAIVRPAGVMSVTLDEALVERLLADSRVDEGERNVLPLLQQTLRDLWPLMERRRLDLASYNRLLQRLGADGESGSVLGRILERRADVIFENLPTEARTLATRLFLRLIHFDARAPVRRRQPLDPWMESASSADDAQHVLDTFGRWRLIVLDRDPLSNERLVDIAHETLIEGWPRLQGWIQHYRAAEETRRRYESRVADWIRYGRAEVGLFHHEEVAEVATWTQSDEAAVVGVSPGLRELLAESRRAANPGWHPVGVVGLIGGALTVAALIALIALYLRSSLAPASLQQMTWLFVALVLVLFGAAFWQLRRSRPHWLQNLSQTIGARRPLQGAFGVGAVGTVLLWFMLTTQISAQERSCEETLGFGHPPLDGFHVAVINSNADPQGAAVLASYMQNRGAALLKSRLVSAEDARSCRTFFNRTVRLQLSADGEEGSAPWIVADFTNARDEEISRSVVYEGSCAAYQTLAAKLLRDLNVVEHQFDEESSLPGPSTCSPYLLNEEGTALDNEKKYELAAQIFAEAIAQSERSGSPFAAAQANLGVVYFRLGRLEESVAQLRTAIEISPSPPVIFYQHLDNACYRLKDWACSEDANQTIIAHRSATPQDLIRAYTVLSITQRETGRYEDALVSLESATQILETSELISAETAQAVEKNQGITLWMQQRHDEAKTTLLTALDRADRYDEEILYYLARIAEDQGDSGAACESWQKYSGQPLSELPEESERRVAAEEQRAKLGCR